MTSNVIIALIISGASLFISIMNNVKSTSKEDSSQITTVIVKLENIQNIVTETKNDIKAVRGDINALDRRLTIVEQSTKSAHKRIDGITHEHFSDDRKEAE